MELELDLGTEKLQGDRPTVLVVDDDVETSELLEDYIDRRMHCDVVLASSGQEAMEMDQDRPANLILMDYLLPDTNGLALMTADACIYRKEIMNDDTL